MIGNGTQKRVILSAPDGGKKGDKREVGFYLTPQEIGLMDLPRENELGDILGLEIFDEFSKLAHIDPVVRIREARQLFVGLILNGANVNGETFRFCPFKDLKRERASPGHYSDGFHQ